MALTRREMLRLALAGGFGAALDPERLLWVPKLTITVPAMPANACMRPPFWFDPSAVKRIADAIDADALRLVQSMMSSNNQTVTFDPGSVKFDLDSAWRLPI